MNKLDGTGSYSVGNLDVDIQHKQILNTLNKISELNLADPNVRQQCYLILEKLSEGAMHHFAFEEYVLRKNNAENISSQILEHNKFFLELRDLKVKLRANEITIPELHNQLKTALEEHIKAEGQQIRL